MDKLDNVDEFKNRGKIAMFIDGDNAEAKLFEKIFAEVSKWGMTTIRQIYGDMASNNLKSWKDVLPLYAILPVHQPPYTTHKNSTDTALIIDAMDILHDDLVDIFCIVSSDSDYTKLAMRIRKSGKFVIGVGRKDTPISFRNACDKFIDTEIFNYNAPVEKEITQKEKVKTKKEEPVDKTAKIAEGSRVKNSDELLSILIQAYENTSNDDGLAYLANMGSYINRVKTDFDLRNFGFSSTKLLPAIKAYPDVFDVTDKPGGASGTTIFVKMKDKYLKKLGIVNAWK